MTNFIKYFDQIKLGDLAQVGGKNSSLGELYSSLTSEGVKIPYGFAVTAEAYRYFIDHNNLKQLIIKEVNSIDFSDLESLNESAGRIRAEIQYGEMPEDLKKAINEAYISLNHPDGTYSEVAVRSSATAEDLPHASFAGQQDTYLNIRGRRNLESSCKKVFASLFTDRAISYRSKHNFDLDSLALSVAVQKMVRSDLACSGVMFTIDTESGSEKIIYITAGYGLGENVVQGIINPDEYYVFKGGLHHKDKSPIVKKQIGDKHLRMVYSHENSAGQSTKNIAVHPHEQELFCLNDEEIVTLANYGLIIERYYTKLNKKYTPMDIEWAKDGIDNTIYVVQARPETVKSKESKSIQTNYILDNCQRDILATGKSVGEKISQGKTRLIFSVEDMNELQPGEILVTDITDPDWEPVLKIAAGIITKRGGRTCHAAIIARELGIPAIVGCQNATEIFQQSQEVTLSCSEGDVGFVYKGKIPFKIEKSEISNSIKTKTKVMLNIGNPQIALKTSALPVDGAGLVRLEFIINNSIKVHPQALIERNSLDEYTKYRIDKIIKGYDNAKHFFIEKLTEGVSIIAAALYPKPVIVRMSDFKTNEYASLIGGDKYEPKEENPMLGFRGAARYNTNAYRKCFELECAALKKAREKVGLDNIIIMLPFVRTIQECKDVLALMESLGLARGKNGLKIYLMCELPANVILAEEFLDLVDGFSIGSNDLTQLTLGVDRDSGILENYDERDLAVKKLISMAIKACKKKNKYIGICGQAPSDFPEFTEFLVNEGIDSISLNPDSVLKMRQLIHEKESNS